MTGAVLDRPRTLFDRAEDRSRGPLGGDRMTLEERLDAAVRSIDAAGSTECPVCSGRMTAERDGARCTDCGSRLR